MNLSMWGNWKKKHTHTLKQDVLLKTLMPPKHPSFEKHDPDIRP